MADDRRTYTREYKLEVLELLKSSGKGQAQLERDLGIGTGNISRWKKEMEAEGPEAFPGKGHLAPEAERIRQLEREVLVLRQERDILKKALGIFSKGSE
jgi:transposase